MEQVDLPFVCLLGDLFSFLIHCCFCIWSPIASGERSFCTCSRFASLTFLRGNGRLWPIQFWPIHFWPAQLAGQFGPIHFWPWLVVWPIWANPFWANPVLCCVVLCYCVCVVLVLLLWLLCVWPLRWTHPSAGPPSAGPPSEGPTNISRFFFPLRHNFIPFFLFLVGLLVEFWWCLQRRDPQMCTFGVLCSSQSGRARSGH